MPHPKIAGIANIGAWQRVGKAEIKV